MIETGELERLIRDDSVRGVTSNPTIFQKALAGGDWYDAELRELASLGDTGEIFFRLAENDVAKACDLLRPVHESSGGLDGYVSIEVDPTLAYDTERTYEQALRLHSEIDRPNLYVKIPATRPGLPAIEDATAAGHAINVTLIFSLQRYSGGRRGLPARARAPRLGGGQPRATSTRSPASSSRASTARPTGGWSRSARPRRWRCAASSPSPTPSSPTATSSRPSRASAGSSWPRRARVSSAASGPRPRPRTRPIPIPSTWTS